jgi:hypothetical protein
MKGRTKNLWMFIVLFLLSVGLGAFFLLMKKPTQEDKKDIITFTKKEGYFGPLDIRGYAFGNVPYIDVLIGDKTIRAKIDLSYQGMLSLPSGLLQDIADKKWVKRIHVHGMRGKISERDVYEVKNIKMQNGRFSPGLIEEISPESMHERVLLGTPDLGEDDFGTLGLDLFACFNVLIDCKHRTIALCDSLETLKKHEYPVESFAEVPMGPNSVCVAFEAQTEGGPRCCMLDTGSTFNFLNKDLRNDHQDNQENKDLLVYDHEDTQKLSSFKIGGKEFGPITFHRIKCPLDIDVILGMEFFNSHLVFIDFENEKVYFSLSRDKK